MEELNEEWLQQRDHERMRAWMIEKGWSVSQYDDPVEMLILEEDESDFTYELNK